MNMAIHFKVRKSIIVNMRKTKIRANKLFKEEKAKRDIKMS